MLSIGGNDFLQQRVQTDAGLLYFAKRVTEFLQTASDWGTTVFIANIYDPTFGKNENDILGIPENFRAAMRGRFNMLNAEIARLTESIMDPQRYLVDLHGHFLIGSPDWFASKIEPSERGAYEVGRVFYKAIKDVPEKSSTPSPWGRSWKESSS